jgi:hypothetical protein
MRSSHVFHKSNAQYEVRPGKTSCKSPKRLNGFRFNLVLSLYIEVGRQVSFQFRLDQYEANLRRNSN